MGFGFPFGHAGWCIPEKQQPARDGIGHAVLVQGAGAAYVSGRSLASGAVAGGRRMGVSELERRSVIRGDAVTRFSLADI